MQVEKRAFVIARVATGNKEDALDIVQDAMMKLISKYADKSSENWPPLFHRILQSHINDWHRRQTVRNRWRSWFNKHPTVEHDGMDSSLENQSNEHDIKPEDDMNRVEFSDSLEKAVTALPLRQKQAFMLRAWEEYSTRETSEIMQCSEGSVKTHYSRALATLRENLQAFSPREYKNETI